MQLRKWLRRRQRSARGDEGCLRFVWLCMLVLAAGCARPRPSVPIPPPSPTPVAHAPVAAKDYATACNQFGIDLLRRVPDGNVVYSPLSLHASLLHMGLASAGPTRNQYSRLLGGDLEELRGQAAKVLATAPFSEMRQTLFAPDPNKIDPQFSRLSPFPNGMELQPLTLAAVSDWYTKNTGARLQAPPLPTEPNAVLLLQALGVKCRWADPFEKRNTIHATFTTREGPVAVRMMGDERGAQLAVRPDYRLLSLPLDAPDLDLQWLLPLQPQGLKKVLQQLNGAELERAWQGLKYSEVRIQMPLLEVRNRLQLLGPLTAMGLRTGPIEKLFRDQPGFLTDVSQSCYLKLDEKGVEAVAVNEMVPTAAGTSDPSEPPSFIVDHPALLLIRHIPSGVVVFWSRLEAPGPL